MKEIVKHTTYGEIVYEESFWNGKKKLTINGDTAETVSKNEYKINDKKIILKGNFLTGVSLNIDNENITITPKTTWYEIAFAILPFLFLIIWGNNTYLCTIFPVVGGGIGGALGGVGGLLSLFFMRKVKSTKFKILIGFGAFIIVVLIAFIWALLLIQLLLLLQ